MGTNVIAKIVPQNNAPIETHEDSFGKGGYTTFATLALRNAQVAARLKVGMRCFVSETGLDYRLVDLTPTWTAIVGVAAVTTTANFTQPAVSSSANASVTATGSFATGEPVFLAGAGQLQVASIVDGLTLSLTNLGYVGNAVPTTVIASGAPLTPSGVIGPTGVAGASGTNAYTATTASFTMPAVASTATATVGNTSWMSVGQTLYLTGAGYLSVSSITDGTHVVLTNTGSLGNAVATTVVTSPAGVSPAGAAAPVPTGTGLVHISANSQDAAAVGMGDLSIVSSALVVASIAGVAGTVSVLAALMQWAPSVTPQLLQATQTSDVASHDLTISSQAPFATATGTNRSGTNVIVALPGATNSSTASGAFKVTQNGTPYLIVGPGAQTQGSAFTQMWVGSAAASSPTASNYAILGDGSTNTFGAATNLNLAISNTNVLTANSSQVAVIPSSLVFSGTTSAPVFSQIDNTTASAVGQVLAIHAQNATGTTATGGILSLASGTGTTAPGTVKISTGVTQQLLISTAQTLMTPPLLSFANTATSTLINQATQTSDVACSDLTISPQAPFATATGTNRSGTNVIVALPGATNSSTVSGYFKVTQNGTMNLAIGPYNSTQGSANTAIYFGANAAAPGASNYGFLGSTTATFIAASTTLHLAVGGTDFVQMTGSSINMFVPSCQWDAGVTSPILKQATQTSDVACSDLTISSQAPFATATGTNANGTNVTVTLPAPTNASTTNGMFKVVSGLRTYLQIGPQNLVAGSATAGLYMNIGVGGISATNHVISSNSATTQLNASTEVDLTVAGSVLLSVTPAGGVFTPANAFTFSNQAAVPVISQTIRGIDAAATAITVRAQGAFATAVTNVNGAPAHIQGGAATSNGVTGTRGGVRLQLGADTNSTFMEIAELALGRRVVAIGSLGAGVTTTNMPANAGDGVIFIANCTTAPTASSVGGGILYCSAGALRYRGSSGTDIQIAAA